ncbi:MAG: DUF3418 domain-containing protein, partial [Myxococcales bacterium]|nr:DUF3418 domain-containing protein [Myxococcales bacterium]
VKEQATLFGLQVFRDRSVDYASIAPAEARRIFIEHALVRGEYRARGAYHEKNQALLSEVARLRRQGAQERHAGRRPGAPRRVRPADPRDRGRRQDVRSLA